MRYARVEARHARDGGAAIHAIFCRADADTLRRLLIARYAATLSSPLARHAMRYAEARCA